jgi:hypothetical protein
MKPLIIPIDVPAESKLGALLPNAYFYDYYELVREFEAKSVLELYLDGLSRTPAWVNVLMSLRNRIVALFGLKDLGSLAAFEQAKPASAYREGDMLGIFSILHLSDNEIILGDSDRHLDVRVSVCKLERPGRGSVAVSTVVHVKNLLGCVYMLFVTPLHKCIVPAILAKI